MQVRLASSNPLFSLPTPTLQAPPPSLSKTLALAPQPSPTSTVVIKGHIVHGKALALAGMVSPAKENNNRAREDKPKSQARKPLHTFVNNVKAGPPSPILRKHAERGAKDKPAVPLRI